jgi:hypothetical protein
VNLRRKGRRAVKLSVENENGKCTNGRHFREKISRKFLGFCFPLRP